MSDNINYERLMRAVFFTPFGRHPITNEIDWGARVVLRGPPGSWKTALLRKLARDVDAAFYSLKFGAKGEGGFGVTPIPKEVTKNGVKETVLSFPVPDWVIDLNSKKRALVAIDELNTAPPAIQAAQLGLIQEKEIGSGYLGAHVRLIGATNETEDAAGGWDLSAAVANRLGHISFPDPRLKKWSVGLLREFIDEPDTTNHYSGEEARVLAARPAAWAKASGQVVSFIQKRPELIRKQPHSGDPQSSKAWPSPRSWDYATKALASAYIHGLNEDERDEFMGAYVGNAAIGEFATWFSEQDLPDPVNVLEETEKFVHDPMRLDRTNAVLNSCAALVIPADAENRTQRAKKLWAIVGEVGKDAQDVASTTAKLLIDAKLTSFKEAMDTLAKMNKVLKAINSAR